MILFALPLHTCNGVCVLRSQNLTVVSPEPLANCFPDGLKLVDITASAWPGIELKHYNKLNYLFLLQIS